MAEWVNPHKFEIHVGVPMPKIVGRGNKRLNGKNLNILLKMKKGDSIWDVPYKKAQSFRQSARLAGIKIKLRRLPHNGLYGIWRIS